MNLRYLLFAALFGGLSAPPEPSSAPARRREDDEDDDEPVVPLELGPFGLSRGMNPLPRSMRGRRDPEFRPSAGSKDDDAMLLSKAEDKRRRRAARNLAVSLKPPEAP